VGYLQEKIDQSIESHPLDCLEMSTILPPEEIQPGHSYISVCRLSLPSPAEIYALLLRDISDTDFVNETLRIGPSSGLVYTLFFATVGEIPPVPNACVLVGKARPGAHLRRLPKGI